MSSHASHKNPEKYSEIKKILQSNLKPAQILLQPQTSNNETYIVKKTVSKKLWKICGKDLDGRLTIESLLCVLKETNLLYNVKVKDDGVVQNLLFSHPGLIHLEIYFEQYKTLKEHLKSASRFQIH